MVRLPTIQGIIDRRLLVNYRVDADVAARIVPAPFRPTLIHGHAMAGICLIRLRHIRPACVPMRAGIASENAAHRIAVEWDQDGRTHEGVFVPRRDSSSRLNTMLGGRLFPGEYHHARFAVAERGDEVRIAFESDDHRAHVAVAGRITDTLPPDSVFTSVEQASRFFEGGAVGYSPSRDPSRFDAMELRCRTWSVEPVAVESVRSSYFEDRTVFPEGSAAFDCALIMRGIEHEWLARPDRCACASATL